MVSLSLEDKDMLLQHRLVKIHKPRQQELDYLQMWMHEKDFGHVKLQGPDCSIWKGTYMPEFVALDARNSEDALTDWITSSVLEIYHSLIGRHTRKVCVS